MNAWQALSLLFVGLAAGLFLGAKYGTKPINEYHFDKVKAKGEGNQITSVIKQPETTGKKRKGIRIFKRKSKSDETKQ